QPALDQGRRRRRDGGSRDGLAQLREVHALQRARESRARLRRGHHLAPGHRRWILGAPAPALQRARAGGARLLHRAHHGAAELAAAAQHRAPPGARGNVGFHGAGVRKRGSAEARQVRSAILGQAEALMKRTLLFAALLWVGTACAQTYPAKPLTIIVPFTPGSATDVAARLVGEKLSAAWGQPVIVDNRAGAGGTIGIAQTARAEADGYT